MLYSTGLYISKPPVRLIYTEYAESPTGITMLYFSFLFSHFIKPTCQICFNTNRATIILYNFQYALSYNYIRSAYSQRNL